MKRPFASVVAAYAAGLLLGHWLALPPGALLAVSFAFLGVAWVWERFQLALLWPTLLLAGWTNYAVRTAVLAPDDLRTLIGDQPALATVRGALLETPRLKLIVRDEEEVWRNVARVRVTALQRDGRSTSATGEILALTPGLPGTNFFGGQTVEIFGVLARPPGPVAEGLFDLRSYLAARGIYYQLKTESTNDWQLRPPVRAAPPLTERFIRWAQQTLARGMPVEDQPLRLLWAMTLGWRAAFTGDLADPFLRAGTMHMFAIDGLRIALLTGMMVTLLRALRLARAWCGALTLPIIWFYTAATGWEPSAIRASVMMSVVLIGWALKHPSDLLNSLAAAAFLILVADPRQLFEASFQLSFFVMLIIAVMLPPMTAFVDRALRHDPLMPEELVPGWQKRLREGTRRFALFAGLSFAAWVGSVPLAARYFHLVSPVSTLANLPAVPLGALALSANLGALLCGGWLPWLTELFNHAAWFLMLLMTWVSEMATKIPGAYFYVPAPSLVSIGLFYGAVIAVCGGWFKTTRRKIGGLIALLFISLLYLGQWLGARGETTLTVLPLNGSHALYVDAAGRQNDWLINCGDENAVEFTLKNFLRARGVNTLPRLVLAEGVSADCGGAARLDDLFAVRELWTGSAQYRSPVWRDAVSRFEKPPSRHRIFHAGETVGPWQVLHPATTALTKAGDSSLVLRGDFTGTKILLLSELNRAGQTALLAGANPNDLRADIVIAGLPGEGEPLSSALLAAIHPRVIVIADSELPATRRASRPLQERLAQTGLPVIYTRASGAVKITTTPRGWKLQTMDGQHLP